MSKFLNSGAQGSTLELKLISLYLPFLLPFVGILALAIECIAF